MKKNKEDVVKRTYPDKYQAMVLWQQAVAGFGTVFKNICPVEYYINHTINVAKCAEKIAALCGLDPDKAFILGLLHDYGKIQNENCNMFHGRYGYEEMTKMGYHDVAKVCLTHTFILKPLDRIVFNYPASWLDWADELLANIEYDEYDRLIQFCDLLPEEFSIVTIEKRLEGIAERYSLTEEQKNAHLSKTLPLKKYFDEKCKCDVYELLNVK